MYSRAETIFSVNNFRIISPARNICDLRVFHNNFNSIKDVPVATFSTAFQSESGTVYILFINESLYFGHSMDHSLTNPKHIHYFSISLSDNPFDSNKDFRMFHNKIFAPFSTELSAIYFTAYIPTD